MRVYTIPLGALQTNGYLVVDEETLDAVIVDPGDSSQTIVHTINEKSLNIKGILITHGHYDHIGAVDEVKRQFNVPVYTHKNEANIMTNSNLNLSLHFSSKMITGKADSFVEDGEVLSLTSSLTFKIIIVPGHSMSSVCYYHKEGKLLFSGDTLLAGTIGRTDLYPGLKGDLVKNIKNKLLILPEDTTVYPGHGFYSTIGKEKTDNIYLK